MNDSKTLNTHPAQSDSFDDFLRQQLHAAYIDDDGFTAQFMARLPAPKTLNPWLEKAIIAVPVLLISLLVLSHFPWRELVQPVYGWFLLQDLTSLLSMGVAVFIALVVAPVAWLFSGES